jgi:hypothetical protein
MTQDVEEISAMSHAFFGNLHESEGTHDMENVLGKVPRKVIQMMNRDLLAPYSEEEVKTALFQMYHTKAPGPDGYPAHFFQRNWDLCGCEVTNSVLRILRGVDSPEEINNTFIVLIPKVAGPKELTHNGWQIKSNIGVQSSTSSSSGWKYRELRFRSFPHNK